MKHLFIALAVSVLGISAAHAERFILKNPRGPIAAAIIQTLKFGKDNYVVVEAPPYSHLLKSFAARADSVAKDAKLGFPTTETGRSTATRAWHPDALKYDQLPSLHDGRGIIVAVVDTGTDFNHPALVNHIYTNAREIPGNGIDDDGNGFIDDVHGYNFADKSGDVLDGVGHGSHCAGIIASDKDPDSNAQGVAPGATVMPLRIFDSPAEGFLSNGVAAIKYAVDNGAKVISASWRVYKSWTDYDPTGANSALLRSAIEYAGEHGVVFVTGAGNETLDMNTGLASDPMYPGGFEGLANMIVTAASTDTGGIAYFSNYGSKYVTLAAPGNDIISTVPGGQWESMSGTSMSTPLAAGAVARGLSAGFTMEHAIHKLVTTSSHSDGWTDKVQSGGVVDLVRYLGE